jgi:hypothetical protein
MSAVVSALLEQVVLALSVLGATVPGTAGPTALLLRVAVSGAAVLVVALAVAAIVLGLVLPSRGETVDRSIVPVAPRQSDPRAAGHPQPRAPGAAA